MIHRATRAGLAAGLLALVTGCEPTCPGATATLVAPDGSLRAEVCAEVASTEADRRRGLLGRASLPVDEGLLIWFPLEGEACITGAGMAFAIDVVFASTAGAVVAVDHLGVDDPQVICHEGVRAALEMADGVAAGVKAGDVLLLRPSPE